MVMPAVGRWRGRVPVPDYTELVYALVLAWGLGDILSTVLAAAVVGPGMEANPWMRVLLAWHPLAALAVKAAVVLYAGVVLLRCRSVVRRVPGWRLWFLGVVGAGLLVTANNLAVVVAAT